MGSSGILDPDLFLRGILGILDPEVMFLPGILGILDPDNLFWHGIQEILDPKFLTLHEILDLNFWLMHIAQVHLQMH